MTKTPRGQRIHRGHSVGKTWQPATFSTSPRARGPLRDLYSELPGMLGRAGNLQDIMGTRVHHFRYALARASRAPPPARAAGAPSRPSNGVGLDNRPIAKSAALH